MRVGRDEAMDCSQASLILLDRVHCVLRAAGNKVVSFFWEAWKTARHCVLRLMWGKTEGPKAELRSQAGVTFLLLKWQGTGSMAKRWGELSL